jgi:N6-adenosine-specific RNA methylase IME4
VSPAQNFSQLLEDAARLRRNGHGDRHIARVCGITRHEARKLIQKFETQAARSGELILPDPPAGAPAAVWAERITASWGRAAAAILETGRLLTAAKKTLPHGEWLPLLGMVGFERRKAQRLMEIAADQRFSNASILPLLPDEWTSVHALHKIDCDVPRLIEYIQNPHLIKAERRAARERELGAKQLAAPDGKFGVIVEDFEWDHITWSERGRDRAAENHYPVSRDAHSAAEIVERTKDRFAHAAEDCVCFMWSTLQHAAIAMDVLRLRGFEYRSQYAWGKDKIGLGYWSREKHEVLLIGVKGNIDCPAPGTQWDSLIMAPRGEHSAKPECFLEMIEQYFPTLPKIELNRRGAARPGWAAWGNEAVDAALHVEGQ